MTCSVEGCERPHRAHGFCNMHLQRFRRNGTTDLVKAWHPIGGSEDPRHGTENGYGNLRCRCPRCRDAHAISHKGYMHAHPEQMERHRDAMRIRRGGVS